MTDVQCISHQKEFFRNNLYHNQKPKPSTPSNTPSSNNKIWHANQCTYGSLSGVTEEEIEENENAMQTTVENGHENSKADGQKFMENRGDSDGFSTDESTGRKEAELNPTQDSTTDNIISTNPQSLGNSRVSMLENGKTIPTIPIILEKDVTPTITEEKVMDNISQWKQGMVNVVEITKVASKQLQKDNVSIRGTIKTVTEHAQLRVNELKQIFKDCGEDMEWELIKKEEVTSTG
ncbi:hypothetical protein C1646_760571 [Rhizophagus diaphanus]|nr:hypothetical protein C1646_760571 [Rhizophagus diaphanus] [Rhizophagus sp. MUCL 43196]